MGFFKRENRFFISVRKKPVFLGPIFDFLKPGLFSLTQKFKRLHVHGSYLLV
jgi:hypothetical protein